MKSLFHLQTDDQSIMYNDRNASQKISNNIINLIPLSLNHPIVIVCIGTDRSTGDSLGPLIGTFLQEVGLQSFHVHGTLDEPVHAVNLEEKLAHIHEMYYTPFIIGIDACLGKLKNIGMIRTAQGPVMPGAGVKKELPPVGDIHITGTVNVSGYMEFFVLQNTRLSLVMKMAKEVAAGIVKADQTYKRRLTILQHENKDHITDQSVN